MPNSSTATVANYAILRTSLVHCGIPTTNLKQGSGKSLHGFAAALGKMVHLRDRRQAMLTIRMTSIAVADRHTRITGHTRLQVSSAAVVARVPARRIFRHDGAEG